MILADGREVKVVTGVDDHSRFAVIATVVPRATGRAVCLALAAAMGAFGVPEELLTDNGKQFTDRFGHGGEVLFDRICRENGIVHRLTQPATPTTTGKVERFHQTLRRELLDDAGVFADLAAAQAAIDGFRIEYNTRRPHQSLGMAFPADRFRANVGDDGQVLLPLKLPTTLTVSPPAGPVPRAAQPVAVEPVAEEVAAAVCLYGWSGRVRAGGATVGEYAGRRETVLDRHRPDQVSPSRSGPTPTSSTC